MFIAVIESIVYLFACAKVGKYLQSRGTVTKQIGGLAAYAVAVLPPAVFRLGLSSYIIAMAIGALGYVTVVFQPKWIVGNR